MQKFGFLLLILSVNAWGQQSEFNAFNQNLLESLDNDVNEISHFMQKVEKHEKSRVPASAKLNLNLRSLQVSVQDTARFNSNKPSFLKSKQATYEIDQIRNFDYKNYHVNGGNNF